jgi:iron(III) transport system substrate-binding protein
MKTRVALAVGAFAAAAALTSAAGAAEIPKPTLDLLKKGGYGEADLKGVEKELAVPAAWIDAAKKEGTLLFRFNVDEKVFGELAPAVQARYPFIKFEYTQGVGAGRAVKPLAAFQTGRLIADVVTAFGSSMEDYLKSDALEPLNDLPAYAAVPDDRKDAKGLWTGFMLSEWCLSYNPTRIKKENLPKTWKDLVAKGSPLAGGKLGMGNRAHLWIINLWGAYGEDYTKNTFIPAIFKDLKPQLRKEGIDGLIKLASIGEFDAAVPSAPYRVKLQADKGAPVAAYCPEPVPLYFTEIGLFKNSPRKHSAKLVLNWLLSKEGQLVHKVVVGATPIHKELNDPKYVAYGEEVIGKKGALRTISMLINDLPKVYEAWNPAWQQAGGPQAQGE